MPEFLFHLLVGGSVAYLLSTSLHMQGIILALTKLSIGGYESAYMFHCLRVLIRFLILILMRLHTGNQTVYLIISHGPDQSFEAYRIDSFVRTRRRRTGVFGTESDRPNLPGPDLHRADRNIQQTIARQLPNSDYGPIEFLSDYESDS